LLQKTKWQQDPQIKNGKNLKCSDKKQKTFLCFGRKKEMMPEALFVSKVPFPNWISKKQGSLSTIAE